MIIGNLDIKGIAVDESKANPPTLVHCDGVLSLPIALQGVQSIARRNLQVFETACQIDVLQLPDGAPSWIRAAAQATELMTTGRTSAAGVDLPRRLTWTPEPQPNYRNPSRGES
jgi:hypothetical protein